MSYERNSDEALDKELSVYGEQASVVDSVVMLPMPDNIKRVETGVIQFGDDWPSVHIRGDNAAYYSMALDSLMAGNVDPMTVGVLAGLNELLKSSKAT